MSLGSASDPRTFIPHRPPVLCIDSVLAVDDHEATAERLVRDDATVHGEIWELWLVEGLAQTAAVLNGRHERVAGVQRRKGMLVGIRGLKIHRNVRAGETVRFRVELIKRMGAVALVAGEASIDGQSIAEGEMKFYVEVF